MFIGIAPLPHTQQEALIDSYFEAAGTKTTKSGKTRDLKRCLICTKKKPGKALARKSDGLVTVHGQHNLREHLERHDVVFGAKKQQQEEEQKRPPLTGGQTPITNYTRMTPREQEAVTQAIVLMCALDNRPLSIVDGRGFQLLVDVATGKRYKMPSRWTITRKCTSMADQARDGTRTIIKVDADAGATFTLSFDAWKDKYVDLCCWLTGSSDASGI